MLVASRVHTDGWELLFGFAVFVALCVLTQSSRWLIRRWGAIRVSFCVLLVWPVGAASYALSVEPSAHDYADRWFWGVRNAGIVTAIALGSVLIWGIWLAPRDRASIAEGSDSFDAE